ncbi:Hypothetical protein, putative [Bodo saltans]|uniref:C2 NT-type domain-containing protein n=1 Tax=Bodo saltans TaxID=75058 RepID=A0A0S4J8X4_BODSA|nr:Hypothetical protein, putative [Bodo saltans]|eukprot:CUG87714.1 Hypothetical protein, putative [Bodo saltans]
MSEPTYNVQFKILHIESPALLSGASYSIGWRRGSYRGNTQPFACDSGVVTLNMPMATAVVHFKHNESGSKGYGKFQSKYLTFNIEEHARGSTKIVGMLEFDVANCLRGSETSAHVVKEAGFRMGGLGAKIDVEVILYPQGSAPPASSTAGARLVEGRQGTSAMMPTTTSTPTNTAPPAAAPSFSSAPAPSTVSTGRVTKAGGGGGRKTLTRDEALTLLLSVEGLLEQSGAAAAKTQYSGEDAETLDRQIQDLQRRVDEARGRLDAKKMLQQAALEVATAGAFTYPGTQFRQLEELPDAKRYSTEVTQYLDALHRQHSATAQRVSADGMPSTLAEVQVRIESTRQDLARLQRDQDELSHLQLRRDVSDEAIRVLGKIQAKEDQLAKLQKHKDILVAQGGSAMPTSTNLWEKEKSTILEEINNLHQRRETLQQVANNGCTMYASRVEAWANRRFAPMREYDKLHKEIQQREEAESKERKQKELQKQILDLFGDMESGPAPPVNNNNGTATGSATAPHESPSSRSGSTAAQQTAAVDVFDTMYTNMPKTTDFGPSATNRAEEHKDQQPATGSSRSASQQNPTEYAFNEPKAPVTAPIVHEKKPVNAFADLAAEMFAPKEKSPPLKPAVSVVVAKPAEFNFGTDEPAQTSSGQSSFAQPARAQVQELKGAYAFGAPEEASKISPQRVGAGITVAPAASIIASEYSFGTSDNNTSSGTAGRGATAAVAAEYSFGGPAVSLHVDPVAAPSTEEASSSVGLWGTPLELVAEARAQSHQSHAAASVYSFGPTDGADSGVSSNTNTYRSTNIFASFDD